MNGALYEKVREMPKRKTPIQIYLTKKIFIDEKFNYWIIPNLIWNPKAAWSKLICNTSSIMHRPNIQIPSLRSPRWLSSFNRKKYSKHFQPRDIQPSDVCRLFRLQIGKHTFRCPCQGPSKWTTVEMKAPCTRWLVPHISSCQEKSHL